MLRVEVTTGPYFFRVVEKNTGDVLLTQNGTTFCFGPELYPVTGADNLALNSVSVPPASI